jgi:hypothetical protein
MQTCWPDLSQSTSERWARYVARASRRATGGSPSAGAAAASPAGPRLLALPGVQDGEEGVAAGKRFHEANAAQQMSS